MNTTSELMKQFGLLLYQSQPVTAHSLVSSDGSRSTIFSLQDASAAQAFAQNFPATEASNTAICNGSQVLMACDYQSALDYLDPAAVEPYMFHSEPCKGTGILAMLEAA